MSLSILWQLQELYLEKLDLEKSLRSELGKELQLEKKKLLARLAALNKRQEEIEFQKRCLKRQEDKYNELISKRESAEANLYSGAIQNPKELESLQQQVDRLKQELDKCAEEFFKSSESIEQAVKELEQERQVINKDRQEYKLKVDSYLSNKEHCEKRLQEVQQAIEQLEETIEPQLLLLYNRKKQNLGPRVLSIVENKTCSACHMVIPSLILKEIKQGQEIVSCENCGRILYWK